MASSSLRILILGGYGMFGARLARLLADQPGLCLIIAGRSLAKAQALCAELPGRAQLVPAAIDRDLPLEAPLRSLAPNLVIDASGPFQAYGEDPYRVVKATLALGIDYMDFADGADFVAGIGRFDGQAQARGIFILSGVSSYPVLTAAVVRHLARDLMQVETIAAGIAPSPYAEIGINVMRAVAGYAGQRVKLTRQGGPALGTALVESMRYTVSPPGFLPLESRRFSLVDVPDLQVLPPLWPGLRSIWIGAAPVPALWHRLLSILAKTVHWRLLPSLSPLARLCHGVINRLRWGADRGGMFVHIEARDRAGKEVVRSWHLLAEGDDGPFIPAMALAAIIGKLGNGQRPAAGARAATAELELADYQPLFAGRAIVSGTRTHDAPPSSLPLYRRMLGDAFEHLPEPLRRLHDLHGMLTAQGLATVARGRNPVARLVAWLFGFPPAGENIPLRVTLSATHHDEHWRRDFAGKRFASRQFAGDGKAQGLLIERFGPFSFRIALVVDRQRLRLVIRGWSAFGVAMPLALAPRGNTFEHAENGRFCFHVEIGLPLVGLVVSYRGFLIPD